jgi:hypothetical protein
MKHISWKYIAGLIDGEGCLDFQVGHSRYNRADGSKAEYLYLTPRLRIAMAEPSRPLMEMLQNQCGGNIWTSPRSHRNENWQDALYWQLENSRLRPVLQETVKFLIIKKEQARFLIWLIDNMRGRQVRERGMKNLDQARHVAREELKAMKRDSQRLSERAVEAVNAALAEATVHPA